MMTAHSQTGCLQPTITIRGFIMARFFLPALLWLAFSAASQAQSDLPVRTLCIFEPVGARGPVYNALLDYQTQSLNWGGQLNLEAYTNEAVGIADSSAG